MRLPVKKFYCTFSFEPPKDTFKIGGYTEKNAYCSFPSIREMKTILVLNTSFARCAIRSKLRSGPVLIRLNLEGEEDN
jgi:hypothetical protein